MKKFKVKKKQEADSKLIPSAYLCPGPLKTCKPKGTSWSDRRFSKKKLGLVLYQQIDTVELLHDEYKY